MDKQGFHQFLKKSGKKAHVIKGLINRVQVFEVYLNSMLQIKLEACSEQALRDYEKTVSPKDVKGQMRAIALYFRFSGNTSLANLASNIREQKIAKTRKVFRLREFRGVKLEEVTKLEAIGIITVEHMLLTGKTSKDRQQLAKRTGISEQSILELVKLSDLSRLGAVKSVRARLYYEAGLDTPDKFSQWELEPLRQMLDEFVKRTGFDGITPLPKELRNTINTAKQLPKVVQY